MRRRHTQAGGIIDAAMSRQLVPIHGIDAGLVMAEVAWRLAWIVEDSRAAVCLCMPQYWCSTGSGQGPEVFQYRRPIREGVCAEVDVLTPEAVHAIPGAVIDQEVAVVEMLVVGQDQPLVGRHAQVQLHPGQLVRPGTAVFPRRGGQNVGIKQLAELVEGVHRARQWLHQCEDAGHFIQTVGISGVYVFAEVAKGAGKIHQHVVHVDLQRFLPHWLSPVDCRDEPIVPALTRTG